MAIVRRFVAVGVFMSVLALMATPVRAETKSPGYVVRPIDSTEELGPKDQCYASVTGRDANGQLQLSDEKCFETYGEVLADVGTPAQSARSTGRAIDLESLAVEAQTLGAPFVLATHFVDADYSGASFSISGNDCLGGGLTLGPAWDNKLSSTLNGCPFVAHYDNGDPMYSGRYQVTVDSGGTSTS